MRIKITYFYDDNGVPGEFEVHTETPKWAFLHKEVNVPAPTYRKWRKAIEQYYEVQDEIRELVKLDEEDK